MKRLLIVGGGVGSILTAAILLKILNPPTAAVEIDTSSYLSDEEIRREALQYGRGPKLSQEQQAQILHDTEESVRERRLVRALFARKWTRGTPDQLPPVEREIFKRMVQRWAESEYADAVDVELAQLPPDTQIELLQQRDGLLCLLIVLPGRMSIQTFVTPE